MRVVQIASWTALAGALATGLFGVAPTAAIAIEFDSRPARETIERLPPVAPSAADGIEISPRATTGAGATAFPTPTPMAPQPFGPPAEVWLDEEPAHFEPAAYTPLDVGLQTVPLGYYAGADYLLIRPHLSEPIAFISGSGGNNTVDATVNTFNFNYQSAPRVFFGYRSPTTGSALQFTYFHFDAADGRSFTADAQNSGFLPSLYVFQLFSNGPPDSNRGDTISAHLRMRLNVFDVEFFKPIAFGGGRWLLTGSAGARIADFRQNFSTVVTDSGGATTLQESTVLGFTGAGPRLGFEARRNLIGATALYVRGGYAILIGGHSANLNYADNQPSAFAASESLVRTVTVGDIELGGSWRPTDRLIFSLGYMFQSWTDLSGTAGLFNLTDNSNILAFDGLVARGELRF